MEFVRHGDILLRPVDAIQGKEIAHNGEYILALGEVTGHSHHLRVQSPDHLKVYKADDGVYLCLLSVGTLSHEEHKTLEIQPGTYRVDMEEEYDPFLASIRRVQD